MENMKMLNDLTSLQNVCDQVENPSSALKTESALLKINIKDVSSALFISTIL